MPQQRNMLWQPERRAARVVPPLYPGIPSSALKTKQNEMRKRVEAKRETGIVRHQLRKANTERDRQHQEWVLSTGHLCPESKGCSFCLAILDPCNTWKWNLSIPGAEKV